MGLLEMDMWLSVDGSVGVVTSRWSLACRIRAIFYGYHWLLVGGQFCVDGIAADDWECL